VLLLAIHHLVFDGWSLDVLYRDLAGCYRAVRTGHPVPPLPAGYPDYVGWLAGQQDRRGRSDLDWWLATLDGASTVLELPRDRPRPPVQSHAGAERRGRLPAGAADRVRALARDKATTPYAVLLAGFAALLRHASGQDDMVIGTPVAGRHRSELEGLIGCFADLLPLFEADPQTRAVVIFGEPGSGHEEAAAAGVAEGRFSKPLIAFVAGESLEAMPGGMIFGHTSAIVGSGQGNASSKKAALKAAGVRLAERFRDLLPLVQEALAGEARPHPRGEGVSVTEA
jgi:hypothetical protein